MRASGYRIKSTSRGLRTTQIENKSYEIYIRRWTNDHVPKDEQLAKYKEYCNLSISDTEFRKTYPTYESYVEDTGYKAGIYISKEEFLANEFLDIDYMAELLENNLALYDAWAGNEKIMSRNPELTSSINNIVKNLVDSDIKRTKDSYIEQLDSEYELMELMG